MHVSLFTNFLFVIDIPINLFICEYNYFFLFELIARNVAGCCPHISEGNMKICLIKCNQSIYMQDSNLCDGF